MGTYTHLSETDVIIDGGFGTDYVIQSYGNGSYQFVDVDGNTVNAHSNEELQKFVAAVVDAQIP